MEKRREELRTQAKRISAAIAQGGNLESLLDHLKGLESEIGRFPVRSKLISRSI